jgi:hypothetical protein
MISYQIDIEKDHKQIKVHYDLSVPVGSPELIATFKVWINGCNVIKDSASGNTRFFGTEFARIADENQDTDVSFDLTSNQGFEATSSDTLRGGHPFDSASFRS